MTSPLCTTISPPVRDRAATRVDDHDFGTEASAYLPPVVDHFVFEDGALRIGVAGSPALMVIAGDVDEATYPGLVGVLQRAAEDHGPIQVDLAGVEYCDLAGLRAIVGMTRAIGHDHIGPRSVALNGVPLHLTVVMRIVGWDSTPGLTCTSRTGDGTVSALGS